MMPCCLWLEPLRCKVALCALESSIHQSWRCLSLLWVTRICKQGCLCPGFFQEIWLNGLFHLNFESPSFQSALESTEDRARVKSKGNKLFHHSTGYIIELILSAWLPVPLEWVFPRSSWLLWEDLPDLSFIHVQIYSVVCKTRLKLNPPNRDQNLITNSSYSFLEFYWCQHWRIKTKLSLFVTIS